MGIKIRAIALSIAGDIIYPPPAMLYSSIAGCYIAVMPLQNNAFSNASQLQGVRELRVKAEVMQTADRGKIQKIGGKTQ